MKRNIAISVLILVVVAVATRWSQPYAPLYYNSLHPDELSLTSDALVVSGYDPRVEDGDIWVPEQLVAQARAELVQQGLPTKVGRSRTFLAEKTSQSWDEQERELRQRTSEELMVFLRLIPGIEDARAKIRDFPDSDSLVSDSESTKKLGCRLLVLLDRKHPLTQPILESIVCTAALSYPGLEATQVKIIDSQMEQLYPPEPKRRRGGRREKRSL